MKRTPLTRSTPLRYRSAKTAAFYRTTRVPLVAEMLADSPRCEFPEGCSDTATTVHELQNRAQGGSLTDRDNLRRSCVFHNELAESEPLYCQSIDWKRMRKSA